MLQGKGNELVAECILNHSPVKSSYEKYEEDAIALGKNLDEGY